MIDENESFEPKYLGKNTAQTTTNTLDLIKWHGGAIDITLECAEFTSRCPVTGQPDFATLKIIYQPNNEIVETKSVKMFLQKYRERKQFNEVLATEIATEFFAQVRPKMAHVVMKFHQRGGIAVTASVTRTSRHATDNDTVKAEGEKTSE